MSTLDVQCDSMLFIFSCSFVILEFIRLWAHSRNAHQINRPSSIVRCPTFDRNAWIRELQVLIVGFPLRSSCGFCCLSADFHKISMFFFSSSSLFVIVFSSFFLRCLFSASSIMFILSFVFATEMISSVVCRAFTLPLVFLRVVHLPVQANSGYGFK